MKATHINYKHPGHIRLEAGHKVLCVSPSSKDYKSLFNKNLKDFNKELESFE